MNCHGIKIKKIIIEEYGYISDEKKNNAAIHGSKQHYPKLKKIIKN
jgi:hypothetical protein